MKKKNPPTWHLLFLVLALIIVAHPSCSYDRGVYQVKKGKHSRLTKGAHPDCIDAWQP